MTASFDWYSLGLYDDKETIDTILKFKPWWRERDVGQSEDSDTCENFSYLKHGIFDLLITLHFLNSPNVLTVHYKCFFPMSRWGRMMEKWVRVN